MGTIDNVYVLNYLVNRQVWRRGRKLIALFVDLRAAFDSMDREVLVEAMKERGIREGFIERVIELLQETRSRVKVEGERGNCFWTARELRQGCPLTPQLFNLVIADIAKELKKVRWGGIKLGKDRIVTLLYANYLVVLAENEDEMRSVMDRLEEYLKKKNLTLNTEKTKILRFKWGEEDWGGGIGGGRVKDWRRLGNISTSKVFQRNGGQEAQLKERMRKAALVK